MTVICLRASPFLQKIRALKSARRLLVGFLFLCWSQLAAAAIPVQYATLTKLSNGGYGLNADFPFQLPDVLQKALKNGTPLYFSLEFRLQKSRWYWSNENVVDVSREYRLSYNRLSQQYRVSFDRQQKQFSKLNSALFYIYRPSQWQVLGKGDWGRRNEYVAKMNFYLNMSKLPQGYQLSDASQDGYGLNTGIYRFTFVP